MAQSRRYSNNHGIEIGILKISAVFCLMGWAFIHLFGDTPIRALVWNHNYFQPVIETFTSMTWEQYVTSDFVDEMIMLFQKTCGALLLVTASALVLSRRTEPGFGLKFLLVLSSLYFGLLASFQFIEAEFQIGKLLGAAAQMSASLMLFLWSVKWAEKYRMTVLKLATAFTFFGHGMYAMGYYPIPGNFIDMVIVTFRISEPSAVMFLKVMGWIDLFAAVGLFIPRLMVPSAIYAVVWGFLTAFARPVSYLSLGTDISALDYWMAEAFYRFPHFMLDILILSRVYDLRILGETIYQSHLKIFKLVPILRSWYRDPNLKLR